MRKNPKVIAAAAGGIVLVGAALLVTRPWSGSDPGRAAAGSTTAAAASHTAYPSLSTSSSTTPSASPSASISPSPDPTPPVAAPTPAANSPHAVGADCAVPGALAGRDVETISDERVMALTFDAGSANTGVDRILSTLRSTGTPATFFLTGAFAQKFPADSTAIAAAYPIGNHSQSHPDLTTLSDDAVHTEIQTARASIMAATGVDPRPYFRFPFGAVDARVISIVNQECMVPFRWTSDSLGWKGTSGGMSAESVRQRVVSGARPGGVVLMHVGSNPNDGSTLDADALPQIISDLSAQGYRFVTLEAILAASP